VPFTPPFALVLSGGGLKGLAHIGTFRALEEFGLAPDVVVGTSMGALIAAAWASGVSVQEMDDRARGVRRRDVFRVAHTDMAFRRMKAPAIYRREPLAELIHSLVGDRTFKDLERMLIVNTVDLNAGMQVFWGAPGLQDVRVADAVFGACALPGVFPPQEIGGRHFVDGAVVDNLPLRAAAALNPNAILAVDLGSSGVLRSDVEEAGFAATYVRGLEIVMQTLVASTLATWTTPPVQQVPPPVERNTMLAFDQTADRRGEG
jgi:NTE family protein